MSRANGLIAWRDYLASYEGGVELSKLSLDMLVMTLATAIAEIEALEQPERQDWLAVKARQEQASSGYADAVVAGVRDGKVAVLAQARMARLIAAEGGVA